MKKIEFSVIMPTFNRGYTIWKSILSVLDQSYPFFELIIIDDGSTDDTAKVIAQFQDPRIRYLRLKKNQGASHARNIGLKKSKKTYIAYLDSDNTWSSDFLFTYQKSILAHAEKKVFYAKKNYRLEIIDLDGNLKTLRDENSASHLYFDLKRLFQRKIIIDTNTIVHEKSIIKEVGMWDENLSFWEDFEFTLRIGSKLGDVFQPINRVLLDYKQTLDFRDQEKVIKHWEESEKYIFEKHKKNLLLNNQNWYPPKESEKSTLSIIEFLKAKKNPT